MGRAAAQKNTSLYRLLTEIVGKVYVRARWPIRPELILVSVA